VFGKNGAEAPSEFQAAISDLANVGFTFGGVAIMPAHPAADSCFRRSAAEQSLWCLSQTLIETFDRCDMLNASERIVRPVREGD
jgi:hypothetical protein